MTAEADAKLPARLVARLAEIVPAERLDAVLASFASPQRPAFRVNPLRARDEDVLAELSGVGVRPEPAAGLEHVYVAAADEREPLVRSAAFVEGRIYIQSLSSLLAAPALGVEPGMSVLDLAAAPGGKTLHLAALMEDRGSISAVEVTPGRFHRLRRNLRLHGVTCCRTYLRDGRRIGRLCPERFDRVLLDAPCSGESQLRGVGEARRPNWSEQKIRQCAGKQRALLAAAVDACRPGGVVLYCTCAISPEENEAVIADALERFGGGLELEAVPLPAAAKGVVVPALNAWRGREFAFPPAEAVGHAAGAVRILPDERFDAFFLGRLRKV